MGPRGLPGTTPDGKSPDDLVRILVAMAMVAEFVSLVTSSPATALAAGLLAWTLRLLLDVR